MGHDNYDHLRESADADSVVDSGGDDPFNFTDEEAPPFNSDDLQAYRYAALHNRIEAFVRWQIDSGYLARNAICGPGEDLHEFMFEFIEAYLEEAIKAEDRHPVQQIIDPEPI